MGRSLHLPAKSSVSIEALPGFNHTYHLDGLNTLPSQGCVFGAASSACRREGEEPLTVRVQLKGQLAVMSSQ